MVTALGYSQTVVLPPIIEREMRTALRAPGALKGRFWVAGASTLAAIFFLFLSMAYGAGVWRSFHKPLFAVALYLAVVIPAQRAAGLFAEERQNQTLGLIYLTGINSLELFFTKFFGGLLVGSSGLLALVPFIALPFLSGGVSFEAFLATAACLPTALVFTISVTILVSILCTDESHALVTVAIVIGVLSFVIPITYVVGNIVAGAPPFAKAWLALSPAFAPFLVFSSFGAPDMKSFWPAIAVTWGWSFVFVGAAAWVLPRIWRDDPDAGVWRCLKMKWFQCAREKMRPPFGANPFQWLVERNRTPVDAARSACAGIIVLWLIAWAVWKEQWPSPINLYATAVVLMTFINMFQTNAATQHIASHRHDGAFELLLTTPLPPQQIVDGQTEGLAAQFRPLRRMVCGVFVVMALGGLLTRPWTWPALISYSLIWVLLIVGVATNRIRSLPAPMWAALNSGRGAWSVVRGGGLGSSFVFQWLFLICLFNARDFYRWSSAGPSTFPSGSVAELVIVLVIGILVVMMTWTRMGQTAQGPDMRARLISQMRSIVQQPVPSPKDPRFRRWDTRERFPE